MRPLRCGSARALLLFMALFLSGCATVGTEEGAQFIVATSEAFSRFKGEYENTTYFKRHKPTSVAVLPFVGVEDKPYSDARNTGFFPCLKPEIAGSEQVIYPGYYIDA